MKRVGHAPMLVTKPEGDCVQRDIRMTFDDAMGGSFEIEIIGESPLKGYTFTVKQKDLKAVRDNGAPSA
jgi:hypothetical protein